MTFFEAIRAGRRNYGEFSGRARRADPVHTFHFADGTSLFTPAFTPMWHTAVFLPSLAVTVRRFRDAGYHWGHIFWVLLRVAGITLLTVLRAQPSHQRRPEDPHNASAAATVTRVQA